MRIAALCWICTLFPVVAQRAQLRSASEVVMPIFVDSNSPAYWQDGELHLFNSAGISYMTTAQDQYSLLEGSLDLVWVDRVEHFPMWIESVWQDSDGTLYAWYHHETAGLCPGSILSVPDIGALVSTDGGKTFSDLGVVLASGDPIDCSARNGFFAGGHGDFSVILDRGGAYFYFLFGNYGGPLDGQGIAVARMAFEDRANPAGAVWKYHAGDWTEPGLGGLVTPIFPAKVAWQAENTDSFWGPSVHWNTYLQSYVVLLNHACCAPKWPQEGIYVTFNSDLSDPAAWTAPTRILAGKDAGFSPAFYPQVLGLYVDESDSIASQVARFYVKGVSKWEIVFSR